MDLYHQIFDPTQVSKSIVCQFLDTDTEQLIISKGTLLQIFEITKPPSFKLKLLTEYKLQGLIIDIKKIKTNDSKLDYLLIAFKKTKSVLLKWDREKSQIVAVSLHYYEHFLSGLSLDNDDRSTTVFKVDPNNQCSVLLYKDSFCFLPFHQEGDDDEEDDDDDENYLPTTSTLKDITYPSFILPASKLDASIRNIIDITFLHNYHEPTLAVLFQPAPTWGGSLAMRKDTTRLLVLSLDLANKTSASIIDIENLPYDLYSLKELTNPIDGLLLIGCNELIHVNSNGGYNGVGVNEYYKDCTSFKLMDMSHLNMRLEDCFISQFFNDRLILFEDVTNKIFSLKFSFNRKNFIIFEEIENHGLTFTKINTLTHLKDRLFFIGCDGSDSLLIKYDFKSSKPNADVEIVAEEAKLKDDDEDLYMEDNDAEIMQDNDIKDIEFIVEDQLANYGPITSFTIGQTSTSLKVLGLPNPNYKENCIIASTGYSQGSSISIIKPTVQPIVKSCLKFSNVNRIWTINDARNQSDYLITTNFDNFKTEIFKISDSYRKIFTADFNVNEITLFITKFRNDQILQITTTSIKLYDYDFHLLTSVKFEVELVFGYSFNDLILITFQDGEVASFEVIENDVLKALRDIKKFEAENKKKKSKEFKKKLEEMKAEVKNKSKYEFSKIQLPKLLNDLIITTGTIVNSSSLTNVKFGGVKRDHDDNPKVSNDNTKIPLFVLITADNRILLFQKNHNEKIFELNGAETLNESLKIGLMIVNKEGLPDPQIKSITVCELGDEYSKEEYLIILTIGGQIIMYKLIFNGVTNEFFKINELAGLKLTGAPDNAYPSGTKIERTLVPLDNFNGLNCVLVTGVKTYLITKNSKSLPKIHQFTSLNSVSMASFANDKVDHGLIFIDDNKNARIVELDSDEDLTNKLPVKKQKNLLDPHESIKSIEYHKASNTFVISTFKEIDYEALDEEGILVAGADINRKMKAETVKGFIKLISPINWTIIDEVELEDNELGLNVRSMNLDISKTAIPFKKEYIIVGSGKFRTEDLSTNGGFKVFEIIDIIPEPGKPETNHKFKRIFEESTKGAITAISEVSGRFITAQGPKLLVRDLHDDNSVVPVAFHDTSVYVTDIKTFENLVVFGDSMESVWLLGFDAEPYRMIMLGKDLVKLDVQCVDFIVYDKQLFILVVDNDNILHLLQYDPEDPTSQLGQRLIRKSIFKLNSKTTTLKRFHKFEEFPKSNMVDKYQCLGANLDGSIYKVTPIAESSYRNFYIIQQQMIDKEFNSFGLNPKLNRFGEMPLHLQNCLSTNTNSISRPILDFDVIKSFINLNDDKRKNICHKIGKNLNADVYRDFIDLERTL